MSSVKKNLLFTKFNEIHKYKKNILWIELFVFPLIFFKTEHMNFKFFWLIFSYISNDEKNLRRVYKKKTFLDTNFTSYMN